MDSHFKISELLIKKLRGELTLEESEKLNLWFDEDSTNIEIFNRLASDMKQSEKLQQYDTFNKRKVWSNLESELFTANISRTIRIKFMKYAAAILIPLLVGGSIWIYFQNSNHTSNNILADNSNVVIQAGTQKATLVLSNGGTVELNAEMNAKSISDNGTKINIEEQSLSYENESKKELLAYNTLTTPRGGEYKLKLSDGTVVMLNAGSSLRFPVAFTDSTRHVFLEGEAYFDVSHNGKPFIVSAQEIDIRVLGTEFNVNAYADEENILTTLVEGKVSISGNEKSETSLAKVILDPNQQAILNSSNNKILVKDVNADLYTAWINGKFSFQKETLESVMKKLSRWYDFEYIFENKEAKDYHYSGRLGRNENINNILEMLELTTNLKFKISNKTIIII